MSKMEENMLTVLPRLNELAKKAKTPEGLTSAESQERDKLRKIYLKAFRANFAAQLENTYIQTPDGQKRKLLKKETEK